MIEAWLLGKGPEVFLIALSLSAARPLAFVMVTPLFTRFGLQAGVLRGGLLLAFSAPVFIGLQAELMAADGVLDLTVLPILLAKEILIGLVLALIVGVPLWAVMAAGDFIDMQRGASMATLVEPGSGENTTVTGTLLFLLMAILLASSDWFRDVLLQNLYATYVTWPVLSPIPALDAEAGALVLAVLDDIMRTGLVLSIPLFGSMFLTEVSLAIAGKYVQQLNIMFLAMSIKQLLYALLLPLYFASLLYYMRGEFVEIQDAAEQMRGFLFPGERPE